jgi:hypothetical protein
MSPDPSKFKPWEQGAQETASNMRLARIGGQGKPYVLRWAGLIGTDQHLFVVHPRLPEKWAEKWAEIGQEACRLSTTGRTQD